MNIQRYSSIFVWENWKIELFWYVLLPFWSCQIIIRLFNLVLFYIVYQCLNPDFAVGIVMKGKKAIKTSGWAGFLVENIVNYGKIRKSSKYLSLQHFFLVIDFNWKIWVKGIIQVYEGYKKSALIFFFGNILFTSPFLLLG